MAMTDGGVVVLGLARLGAVVGEHRGRAEWGWVPAGVLDDRDDLEGHKARHVATLLTVGDTALFWTPVVAHLDTVGELVGAVPPPWVT